MLILFASFLSGCTNPTVQNSSYNSDFSFYLINGEEVHISNYAGKVVLVDLTGVHCSYCVPQTFVLDEINNQYSNDDFEIISIFVWMILGETVSQINNLIDAYACISPCDLENIFTRIQLREAKEYYGKQEGIDMNWVIGYDNEQGALYEKYGEEGIPYLMILDNNGNVYYSNIGLTSYSSITEKIDELL